MRGLFRSSWAFYPGQLSRRFFRHYGVAEHRLVFAPHSVDNTYFRNEFINRRNERSDLRREFGITDDAPVILFAGKFIDIKEPLVLLEAFASVRRLAACWLLMVGDGPLRHAVGERVARQRIPGVRLTGFLNQSEMPAAYLAADVFTLPSRAETWGLATNEAMNFELPIVVSDGVGCAPDLVRHGWNGYVFRRGDTDELVGALSRLVGDAKERKRFGSRSVEVISAYNVQATGDGITAGLQACVAKSRMTQSGNRARR